MKADMGREHSMNEIKGKPINVLGKKFKGEHH
jgi:hypothetical protein